MPTKTKGITRRCLGPFDPATKTWGRKCGLELTPIIEERVPVDGKSHDFECPKCKAPHHATRMPEKLDA